MQRDTSKFKEDRDPNLGTQSSQNDEDEYDSGPDLQRFVGQTIKDTYKIVELVGQGGMSAVFRAEHIVTQKTVALKLMHMHLLTDNNSVRRFQQEAKAASRLQHQHAISISDMGVTDDGQPFLVMDFLEGWSLSEVIKFDGKLALTRAYHIFNQACSAIAHAHDKGIVHRDLKPSNIMLIRNGRDPDFVKVVDFGIAKILPDGGGEELKLTATGEVFGSPLYMSPEQCMGLPLDARSDIYSMGCLMYEALSGHAPLEGRNMMETMYKQMNEQADALSGVDGDVRQVKKLDEIIQKCMAKKPDQRYESMDELAEDLEEAASSVGGSKVAAQVGLNMTQATRALKNKTGPRWKLIFSLVGGVTLLALGLGWFANDRFFSTAGDPAAKERTLDLNFNFANGDDDKNVDKIEGIQFFHRGVAKLAAKFVAADPSREFYDEMKYGDLYMKVGRADKALSSYNAAEHSIPQSQLELLASDYAHLLRGKAFCNLMKGNLAQAEAEATKALDLIQNTLQSQSSWTKLSNLGLLAELHRQQHDPRLAADLEPIMSTYNRNRTRTNDLEHKNDIEPDYPYAAAIALKQGGDGAFSLGRLELAETMYHHSLKEWVDLEAAQTKGRVALDEGVLLNDLGLIALSQKYYQTESANPLKQQFVDDLNMDWILNGTQPDTKTKELDLKPISEPTWLRDDHGRLLFDEHKYPRMVYPKIGAIGYFKAAASRMTKEDPGMAIALFNLADAYRANKDYLNAAQTRLQAQRVFRDASKAQSR